MDKVQKSGIICWKIGGYPASIFLKKGLAAPKL
jgi:hypothetical protein